MEVVLQKIGRHTGFVFPPGAAESLGMKAGQRVTMTVESGKLVLTPQRRFSLAEMLAQCDPDAPGPADLIAWDRAAPKGRELL